MPNGRGSKMPSEKGQKGYPVVQGVVRVASLVGR